MNDRSRLLMALLGTVIAAGGCASVADRAPRPRASAPPFQQGEVRSVPDPLTLLSEDLRDDLRLDKDRRRSQCKNHGYLAKGSVTKWECLLRPPQGSKVTLPDGENMPSARGGEMRIDMELHHPKAGRTATALAAASYADTEGVFRPGSRDLRVGDESIVSPDKQADTHLAVVRVRNAVFVVTAAPYAVRKQPTFTERERLIERVANDLARALTDLAA